MLIGEIAKKTGFTPDTIRWYEKIGLIQLDRRSRGRNNYRIYDQHTLEMLIAIKKIKSLGFTLKETEQLLSLEKTDNVNCQVVSPIIDSKINLIDQKIAELERIKSRLTKAKNDCKGECEKVIYR